MAGIDSTSIPTDLATLAQGLRRGDLDAGDYLDALLDRIDERNPEVLALLPEEDRRGRLHADLAALEARFPAPATRPALYGVPVAVKDIVRVDGLVTRAGSALPPTLFEGAEATVVTRLRAAGALILAKAVTTEFAYFEPGPTRNPRNLEHTPGGSSSGSAAAVAAGLAPLAIGSQTVGSVLRPAAFCGVVGFKPSYDRIPRDGVIPYSPSVDHVGLFASDVEGVALAAAALLDGWDASRHAEARGQSPVLAVPDGPYLQQAELAALDAFEAQLAALAASGVTIRRIPAFEDIAAITERHRAIASAEFADTHSRWFDEYGALYRPRTAALVRTGRAVTAEEREAGFESRLELREHLHRLLDEHGIDAWVSPSATGAAPEGLASTGDPAMNLPWTHAGVPAVSIPAGLASNGLPLGVQIAARFGADEASLAWAERLFEALRG